MQSLHITVMASADLISVISERESLGSHIAITAASVFLINELSKVQFLAVFLVLHQVGDLFIVY